MSTQAALIVREIGKPVTTVHNWPIPQPGPKQIQVRVTIAGLNPHDGKGREMGLFIKDDLPAVLGSDIVGVVTVRGKDAGRFNVGDKVFGQGSLAKGSVSKGLQEYALLDEDFAARVTEGVGEHGSATVPTNLLAGVIGFFDPQGGLALPFPWTIPNSSPSLQSSSILIIGGGSNCGRFTTQLASLVGFNIIVVVGGNPDELKRFGATHVIDRHGGHDKVLEAIQDVVGDNLLYAFDTVNNPPEQHLAINALSNSKKGKLARLTYSRGELNQSLIHPKNTGYELKNVVGISAVKPDIAKPFWEHLEAYLKQGKLWPLESYVVKKGLEEGNVNEALDRWRDGKGGVQTHVRISE